MRIKDIITQHEFRWQIKKFSPPLCGNKKGEFVNSCFKFKCLKALVQNMSKLLTVSYIYEV